MTNIEPTSSSLSSSSVDLTQSDQGHPTDRLGDGRETRFDDREKSDLAPTKRIEYSRGDVIAKRFEIIEPLGQGGFGTVYRAKDRVLHRLVAVKRSTVLRSFVAGRVRNEAQAIASLNHPNIIAIHDLISVGDNELLIVMEYLDGETLSMPLRSGRLTIGTAVDVIEQVALALQHAHERNLVHSDLKPANVFLASSGVVKLLDFGLAVACFSDETLPCVGGTPGYMSPEQVRGESHLIDGRTDIWGLGTMFYELLTGKRPFSGPNTEAIYAATLRKEVPPPRQVVPEIDDELQRIVLCCLEKRMCDRYDAMVSFLEDLRAWRDAHPTTEHLLSSGILVRKPASVNQQINSSGNLCNRGLQPFTETDASDYRQLIPGSRDRHGVPNSIRFWQRWVESNDSATEYPVGVLYGPSGSGKSSFVRAGLIPALDSRFLTVYLECRPGDLAKRLIRLIESQYQTQPSGSSLRDVLTRVRTDESDSRRFRKLTIILDQFEVWGQATTREARLEFAEALRQCDGVQLRALLVTRDDYWLGVRELLKWLELPIQEGRNVAAIDLIDPPHALQILESMGRENGMLPPLPQPLSQEQRSFLSQSVDELTHNNSVVCVHLVMFAQMARLQHWQPHLLAQSGGVVGSCSLFFQDLFTDRAHPECYRVASAVLAIVERLLPSVGKSVLDASATKAELTTCLANAKCLHLLDDSLRILAEDLRVVSVVAPDVSEFDSASNIVGATVAASNEFAGLAQETRYRLAHDFLVAPLRQWIERMHNRSWQGRVKTRLTELSETWSQRQGTIGYFPRFIEFVTLFARSRFIDRSENEQRYLRASARYHAGKISVTLLAMIALFVMSLISWRQWTDAREARHAALISEIDLLLDGSPSEVPLHIERLGRLGTVAIQQALRWADSINVQRRFRSRLFVQLRSNSSFAAVASELEHAEPELFEAVLRAASASPDGLNQLRATAMESASIVASTRAAILAMYLGDSEPLETLLMGSDDATRDQTIVLAASNWRADPTPFATMLANDQLDAQVRFQAAVILDSYPRSELNAAAVPIDTAALANASDAALHSAGRFLAFHLGQDFAAIPFSPPADANWKVGPSNIPMVRIPKQELTYETTNLDITKSNKLSNYSACCQSFGWQRWQNACF